MERRSGSYVPLNQTWWSLFTFDSQSNSRYLVVHSFFDKVDYLGTYDMSIYVTHQLYSGYPTRQFDFTTIVEYCKIINIEDPNFHPNYTYSIRGGIKKWSLDLKKLEQVPNCTLTAYYSCKWNDASEPGEWPSFINLTNRTNDEGFELFYMIDVNDTSYLEKVFNFTFTVQFFNETNKYNPKLNF